MYLKLKEIFSENDITLQKIQDLIDEHIKLIPSYSIHIHEAEERAPKFLHIQNIISKFLLTIRTEKIKYQTEIDCKYQQLDDSLKESSKVTERKIKILGNEGYVEIREKIEACDALISYLRTNLDIFKDAHIHYRRISKGD